MTFTLINNNKDLYSFNPSDFEAYSFICSLNKEHQRINKKPNWFINSLVPAKTNDLKKHLFLPSLNHVNQMYKVKKVASFLFVAISALKFVSFCWDIATLLVRCVTILPKAYYLKLHPDTIVPSCFRFCLNENQIKQIEESKKIAIRLENKDPDKKIVYFNYSRTGDKSVIDTDLVSDFINSKLFGVVVEYVDIHNNKIIEHCPRIEDYYPDILSYNIRGLGIKENTPLKIKFKNFNRIKAEWEIVKSYKVPYDTIKNHLQGIKFDITTKDKSYKISPIDVEVK